MGLVGKLEHFTLTDLLQILASARKTGTLTLTLRFDQGLVVLRQGKIIYAASTSSRQTLGSALVSRDLISEEDLTIALEEMLDASREQRLGTILVESGVIDAETLTEVLSDQVRSVLAEFLEWHGAYFQFEPLQIADHGEIEVDAKDFLLEHGLAAEEVLLELLRSEDPESDDGFDFGEEAAGPAAGPVASLWSIMSEIQPPEFTGEITLRILEHSRERLARGALFGVFHDGYRRMSQFGVSTLLSDDVLQDFILPADGDSILAHVVHTRRAFRGSLPPTPANRELLRGLGGGEPIEATAIPMIVGGRVIAVLYGDDGVAGQGLRPTHSLEIHLAEVSLAIERSALEKRLRHLDQIRHRRRGER